MRNINERRIAREYTEARENVVKLCEAITETVYTKYNPLLMTSVCWGDINAMRHVETVLQDLADFLNITGEYAEGSC